MNKYSDVIKKWLDEPESVTQKELADNSEATNTYASAVNAAAHINTSLFLPRNIGLTVMKN